MDVRRFSIATFAGLLALVMLGLAVAGSPKPAQAARAGGSGDCDLMTEAANCAESLTLAVPGDQDNDGVCDRGRRTGNCRGTDLCRDTAAGAKVDSNGCSQRQVDEDGDGICNFLRSSSLCRGWDFCPGTAAGSPVDNYGCSRQQTDSDGDGVCDPGTWFSGYCNGWDRCPNTPANTPVDNNGCPRTATRTPSPAATRTPTAANTSVPPTATRTSTATPTATNTTVPPTATPVPPTATPTPPACTLISFFPLISFFFQYSAGAPVPVSFCQVTSTETMLTVVFYYDPTQNPPSLLWNDGMNNNDVVSPSYVIDKTAKTITVIFDDFSTPQYNAE